MKDYQKYINALRKCAKEHDNDRTSTGHIIVSDLCRDTANLLEKAEQEPCEDCKRVDRFIEKEGVVISQLRADRDRLLEGYEKLKAEIADVLQTIEQIINSEEREE